MPSPSTLEFSVDVVVGRHGTVAYLMGEIDSATCHRLRDAIEPHLGADQRVIVDLSGVSFMDSTCLNVLIKAQATLSADGGSMILRNPSSAARTLLKEPGLARLFTLEIG